MACGLWDLVKVTVECWLWNSMDASKGTYGFVKWLFDSECLTETDLEFDIMII